MTLVFLAAGLGSRFGGPKQFWPVGPNGECLMHYSAYDAAAAGFSRLVLITRAELREQAQQFLASLPKSWSTEIVEQIVVDGKPRGTGDAILSCGDLLTGPFCPLNADDFYGKEAFSDVTSLGASLTTEIPAGLLPYPVEKTLPPSGGVSRAAIKGVPERVEHVWELRGVQRQEDGQISGSIDGRTVELHPEDPVSMNFFAFLPQILPHLQTYFDELQAVDPGIEVGLPQFLDHAISSNLFSVRYKMTGADWFGMTFPEDLDEVRAKLRSLHDSGAYPPSLR